LPPEDRVAFNGVDYAPPAARGDVLRASESYGAILLVDGLFHHDLAPTPNEVLTASRRADFFGASSMGALRAAECAPFGAIPLGIIARWYLREAIDGDDEVAVLVDSKTQQALTVPLVNVRYVTWLAARRGLITRAQGEELVTRARRIFYADRSWHDVIALAPAHAKSAFGSVAHAYGDLKRNDARFALRSVLRRLAS